MTWQHSAALREAEISSAVSWRHFQCNLHSKCVRGIKCFNEDESYHPLCLSFNHLRQVQSLWASAVRCCKPGDITLGIYDSIHEEFRSLLPAVTRMDINKLVQWLWQCGLLRKAVKVWTYCFCLCSAHSPSERSTCKKQQIKERRLQKCPAGTIQRAWALPHLPAENISKFGSAFGLVVFFLCETEEWSAFFKKTTDIKNHLCEPFAETNISLTKFEGKAPTLPFFTPIHHPSSICAANNVCSPGQNRMCAFRNIQHTFKTKTKHKKQTTDQ